VRALTAAMALTVVLGAPGRARAFHDPDEYGHEAMQGGGARSWFTGSPRFAGYDCSMCHVQAPGRAGLVLSSSPEGLFDTSRYVPEAEYRITVRLEGAGRAAGSAADRNAFTAEAVLDDGRAPAGTLDASDDRVQLVDDGRVVGPSASFASGTEWSFTWTAPPAGSGPVWLHLAAVDGDSDGSPAGDDVATRALRFGELGGTQTATEAGYDAAGCAAAPGRTAEAPLWAVVLLLAAVRRRSAWKHDRAKRNVSRQSREVPVESDERRPGCSRRQREEHVVLQAREPDLLVIAEGSGDHAARVEPAAPPRGRLQGDQPVDELRHGACGPAPAGAPEELAGHDRRQANGPAADRREDHLRREIAAQQRHVDARVKEGDHRSRLAGRIRLSRPGPGGWRAAPPLRAGGR